MLPASCNRLLRTVHENGAHALVFPPAQASLFINLFVVSVFAAGFYRPGEELPDIGLKNAGVGQFTNDSNFGRPAHCCGQRHIIRRSGLKRHRKGG